MYDSHLHSVCEHAYLFFTPQHSLYSNSRTNINCFHAREYEIKNHNGMYYQKSVILPGTIKADQTNQQSE